MSIVVPGNTVDASIGRLTPFMLDNLPVRGKVLRIDDLVSQIPSLGEKDTLIGQCLAELLVICTVMAKDLKQGADVTVQIHSEGPASLLIAQCNYDGSLKAYANVEGDSRTLTFADIATPNSILIVTVRYPDHDAPVQSMVRLSKESIIASIETYFNESVQLNTLMRVFTERKEGHMPVGALFLQALPDSGDALAEDEWNRMTMLMNTLTPEETLPGTISEEELLRRIFAEDQVRVFPPSELNFLVHDVKQRMERALKNLGENQYLQLLDEGPIEMTCEFTGKTFTFTKEDMPRIFNNAPKKA